MNRKRPVTILATAVLCAMSALAQEMTMTVAFSDGTDETFALGSRPRITFSGSRIDIGSDVKNVSYERDEVSRIYFVEKISSSAAISANAAKCLRFVGGEISAPGQEISLYDLSGRLIVTGCDHINLQHMSCGIYVARTSAEAMKIHISGN